MVNFQHHNSSAVKTEMCIFVFFFFQYLWWIESYSKEQHLLKYVFCNVMHVFTLTFGHLM